MKRAMTILLVEIAQPERTAWP